MRELDLLCELWNCALREYYYNNELNVTYDILKVIFFPNGQKEKCTRLVRKIGKESQFVINSVME